MPIAPRRRRRRMPEVFPCNAHTLPNRLDLMRGEWRLYSNVGRLKGSEEPREAASPLFLAMVPLALFLFGGQASDELRAKLPPDDRQREILSHERSELLP